jgi:hypothetical protein
MKKRLRSRRPILLIIIALFLFIADYYKDKLPDAVAPSTTLQTSIEQAYKNKLQSVQIQGKGTVVKLLPDDLKGSQHQKFILKVSKDLTVLIAHNIDLAPRINMLKKGDEIAFNGEYEYNSKGGVIHWTHHDPGKKHQDGWLEHRGKTYQ